MIEILVKEQELFITSLPEQLVSGTKNYIAHFTFDNSWDGFLKTAIFEIQTEGNCYPLSIGKFINDQNICQIPVIALIPNTKIRIGVYGVKNKQATPTIYSPSLFIRQGAFPIFPIDEEDKTVYQEMLEIVDDIENKVDGFESRLNDVENNIEDIEDDINNINNAITDINNKIGNINNLETEDKSNIVASINETLNFAKSIDLQMVDDNNGNLTINLIHNEINAQLT